MESPLPAHKRAEILVPRRRRARTPGRRGSPADRRRGGQAAQGRARRGRVERCRPTRWRPSRRARSPARWCRWTPRRQERASSRSRCAARSASSARSRRSTSRSTSSPTRSRLRSPPAAPSCSSPPRRHPLSALLLAELEDEAGLPPGWLNVVVGPSSEIGDVLVEDERVKLITFTGSGAVGWGIRERAAEEEGRARARQRDAGDRRGRRERRGRRDPVRRERVLVRRAELHLGAADLRPAERLRRLQGAFRARRSRRSSSATRPTRATDVGPLISPRERDRVLAWIEQARDGGAHDPRRAVMLEGELLRPTVVEEPPADAHLACDEAFGPVCTLQAYDTLDEAIERANATRYGLQAGVFTASLASALAGLADASSSAASRSTRRRPSAPTRCPTAASRTRATRAKARPGPSAR